MTLYIEYNLRMIADNYLNMKKLCHDVCFIFPLKCCTNKQMIEIIYEYADGFDVSNESEYNYIAEYLDNKTICSTGPLSKELIKKRDVLVAVNSVNSWKKNCGIRVNFNDDDNFIKSHFGVALSEIPLEITSNSKYVHFHVSDRRTEEIKRKIMYQIVRVLELFPKLEILNIGGHLTNMSQDEAVSYINCIRGILPQNIKLIVEAGDYFVDRCGFLHCEVIDVFFNGTLQIVYLNVSKESQLRWSHPRIASKFCKDSDTLFNTVFYGASCYENDIIAKCICSKLKVGDEMVFENITTYSSEWNKSFNGLKEIETIFR